RLAGRRLDRAALGLADKRVAQNGVAANRHAAALPKHPEVHALLAIEEDDGFTIAEGPARAGVVGRAHAGAAARAGERLASTSRTRRQKLQSVPYAGMPHDAHS